MANTDEAKQSDPTLDYDRPRGIFSEVDRRFLHGIKEYDERRNRYERRREIRKRVKNSLIDLHFLRHLDRDELDTITEEVGAFTAVSDLITFAANASDNDLRGLEHAIETGLSGWGGPFSGDIVEVDIDVQHTPNADRIEEQFRDGDTLTAAEKGILVEEGRLSEGDLEDLKREQDPVMRAPRQLTRDRSHSRGEPEGSDHVPATPFDTEDGQTDGDETDDGDDE